MSFPPNCGQRFAELLELGSGKNAAEPCGLFCTELDYETALDRLDTVKSKVLQSWNAVIHGENKAQNGYPVSTEYEAVYTAWDNKIDALPPMWKVALSLNTRTHVEKAWSLIVEGVCLYDVLDAAAAAYGETGAINDPYVPDPPPDENFFDFVGDGARAAGIVVGLAIVGAVAFAVYRSQK